MPDTHRFTDLQIAVLRVIWERGRATVAEITEALRPDRRLAQTTIATILSRLERRAVVAHETRNRQFVYSSRVSAAEVRRSMVRELAERWFEGDVTALAAHLLSQREMSAGDLARVKAIVAEHESSKGGR
jgi:predicted transcriptional regulator